LLVLTASSHAVAQARLYLEPTIGIAKTTPTEEINADTKGAIGYRVGLGLRYINSPLVLTTGLFYQSAGFQFKAFSFAYTIDGSWMGHQPATIGVRAHYITVPATVGLRFVVGKRASITPSIGLEAAGLLGTDERLKDEPMGVPRFYATESGMDFRELSLYGMFQLRFQKALTGNTTLFIAPVVRHGLTSIYAQPSRYRFLERQYFMLLGADAGVSIKL
jgi:hypothetical protein